MEEVLNRTYKQARVKQYNILYVDDEEVNLRVFQRTFKKYYHVFIALSGKEAMRILKENPIDLIMTDQRMPGMSGTELLARIVPLYPHIVRMIMTGFSDEKEIVKLNKTVGLDRFLIKPWNQEDLKKEFETALARRNAPESQNHSLEQTTAQKKVPPTKSVKSAEDIKKEIARSVEDRKYMMSTVNMDQVIEFNILLRDALMPKQEELRLYLEDAFILYDHHQVNQHGYWFGECDQKILIASFHVKSGLIHTLTLNTFVCATLVEIVYKEQLFDPNKIAAILSQRIQNRFFRKKYDKNICTIDMALLAYDKTDESLLFGGANQHVYTFDKKSQFKTLQGDVSPLIPGVDTNLHVTQFDTFEISELYFISSHFMKENQSPDASVLSTRQLLEELHKFPMLTQSKLLREYKYKSLIGIRF